VFAYPRSQLFLGQTSGCNGLDNVGCIYFLRHQFTLVHLQEHVNHGKLGLNGLDGELLE
jgi:hypothetical protein